MKYVKTEVDEILLQLRIGQRITIRYYDTYEKAFLFHIGRVSQINNYWKRWRWEK